MADLKYKVGDIVTVRGKIVEADAGYGRWPYVVELLSDKDTIGVGESDITGRVDQPMPGDRVRHAVMTSWGVGIIVTQIQDTHEYDFVNTDDEGNIGIREMSGTFYSVHFTQLTTLQNVRFVHSVNIARA